LDVELVETGTFHRGKKTEAKKCPDGMRAKGVKARLKKRHPSRISEILKGA